MQEVNTHIYVHTKKIPQPLFVKMMRVHPFIEITGN